jgi:uncharacterized membrane protein YhiD involved in acid resistance
MTESFESLFSDILSILHLSDKDLFNIIFSMFLAFVIGLAISQVYKRTQRGLNHELSYMISIVVLAPLVTLVMLFIRNDLIISLGLIGSLSIIRFRTAVKDTRDMVFLFWSIVVGLGAGTFNWTAIVLGSIFVIVIIFILYLFNYGKSKNQDYILVISADQKINFEEIEKVINPFVINMNIRSQEIQDGNSEMVLELDLKNHNPKEIERFTKLLFAVEYVKSVSLLSPQLSLPA